MTAHISCLGSPLRMRFKSQLAGRSHITCVGCTPDWIAARLSHGGARRQRSHRLFPGTCEKWSGVECVYEGGTKTKSRLSGSDESRGNKNCLSASLSTCSDAIAPPVAGLWRLYACKTVLLETRRRTLIIQRTVAS